MGRVDFEFDRLPLQDFHLERKRSRGPETEQRQCDFCLLPERKTTEAFRELHGEIPHTLDIPGLPKGWTALQDVVPVAEHGGHILLMPDMHRISLATVEDQEKVGQATEAVLFGLHRFFPDNPVFFFEHGPGFVDGQPIACGGCHLDHAHGHFLLMPEGTLLEPIQNTLETIFANANYEPFDRYEYEQLVPFSELPEVAGIHPYLHIGMIDPGQNTSRSVTYVQTSPTQVMESQLMRRVISSQVYGKPNPREWHWRDITAGFVPGETVRKVQRDIREFRAKTGF